MKRIFFFLILFSFFTSSAQDRSKWFEFYLPWDDSTKTVTDMSAYLDAPAGKYGFLKTTPDGHFRFENSNENIRFVGVVNVSLANFPTKAEANIIAARMAKFGINLCRVHLMDLEGGDGLFENSAQNTLDLSPDRLDKMDYFIKCLKDRGIYFNFCIQSARIFKAADGIDAPIGNRQSKYSTIFNQKLINLQKDFANKTINHINPYTGLTYANDPAMISVELTNENSLLNGWIGWGFGELFADHPAGIGPVYAQELDTRFNIWLAAKYANDSELNQTWAGLNGETPTELVKNGSFEQDLTNWSPWINTPLVVGSISIDATAAKNGSKSAKILVTQTGEQNWYCQIKTNNLPVKEGMAYKLSFYTKSNVEKELSIDIMENDTWKYIASPSYTTSTNWKLYELYFTSPFQSGKAIAQFNFGNQTGTFWLDSVSLVLNPGIGLKKGESLGLKNIKRTKAAEMPSYTDQRVGDNAAFYFDLEKKYTQELSDYLKIDLGVKCPVTFTNNYFGLASIYSQSQADFIDTHYYWGGNINQNATSYMELVFTNKSILLDPENSTINQMQLCKVKNMPLVLSEYNHPYPYIFQSEAPSLLYAYGSFFDLDGIYWHAYYDWMNRYSQREQDMDYDIAMHPVMMTQMMLSIPYRMNYIKKAQTYAEGNFKTQDVFNNSKIYKADNVLNLKHTEIGTSLLQHGFRNADFDADSSFLSGAIANPGKVITSETNELKWDGAQGFFTVNNPFWQGATGYLGGKNIELNDITISGVSTTDNLNFAAIHLIALDSLPIKQSKKMLLLTSARMENEGLKWNSAQTSLLSVGGTRALCEPVEATIKFKLASANSFKVYSLNEKGQRSASLLIEQITKSTKFNLDKNTLWYEISNQRIPVESISISSPAGNTISTDKGTLQFQAILLPENATTKDVNWSVLNVTGRASVSASGLITAERNGVVKVIATSTDGFEIKGELQIAISNQSFPLGNQTVINDKNSYLKIHPNPAKDYSIVEFLFLGKKNARFVIFNPMGQCLKNEPIQLSQDLKNEKQLNTAELQNGLYFCGFQFDDGELVLEKLMINH